MCYSFAKVEGWSSQGRRIS